MRQATPRALAVVTLLAVGAVRADDASPPPDPRLRLIDAGRAPLKALRYRARPGQMAHLSMSIKMGMALKVGGQALPPTTMPEIRCGFDLKVVDVSPAGDIRYDFEYGAFEVASDPGTPPAALESMRTLFAGLKGLRGHGVTTSRGFMREGTIQVPADAQPQLKEIIDSMQQSLRQLAAPLPEEPVGAGARWETTYLLVQKGIRIDQVANNEVKALDGDRMDLVVSITQSAPVQRMDAPGLPPNARMDLVSLASTGGGTSTLDLGRLVPSAASVKLKMQMKTRMQTGEEKPQDIDMTMDMDMSVSGR